MRYYRKMLFAFLAVALAYTVLLDVIFLYSNWRSSRQEYARTMDAVAQQVSDYTDYQLRSLQELSMLLRASEDMKKYLNEDMEAPDRYARYQLFRFVNSIYGVASAQNRGLAVTKLVDDYVIMQSSTGNIAHLLEQFSITRAQLEEAVATFGGQIGQPMRLIRGTDAQGGPLYTVITRQWVGRPYPFYLLVSYTEDQLFSLDRAHEGSLAILYWDALWAHAGTYGDAEIQDALGGADTGMQRRDLPSSIPGVRYVYLSPRPGVVTGTSLLILAAGFAALAVSALLMFLITRRMYSPIADVLSATGTDAIRGDEFAGLQETFSALQTNMESMTQSLSQYYDTVENKFFHDLLTGLVPQEQLAERLRQFGIPDLPGPYIAVLVRFEETLEPGTDSEHAAVYAVRAALTRALRDSRALMRVVDIHLMAQGLIFRQTEAGQLEEYLRGVLLQVEPEYGLEATAYVGGSVDSLARLHASYRVAARLAEDSEYTAVRSKVIALGMERPGTPGSVHNVYYPLNMEQSLINAVIHGRTSVMESVIHELMTANEADYAGNRSPLSLMLTATVNRILDGVKRQVSDIFAEDTIVYLEFRSCETYAQLEAKATEIFTTLASYLAAETRKSSETIEKKMTDFIAANFERDISMFDLADHVNMSRNYVSTLFKHSTGQTFKDYLGQLRHARACEIIAGEPGVKLRDVAARVGCSPDTLLRLFMRHSGMSPSDYQQQCRGEPGASA